LLSKPPDELDTKCNKEGVGCMISLANYAECDTLATTGRLICTRCFPFLLPPVLPVIPVVIPMAVGLSDAVSRELIVRMPTTEVQGL